MIEISAALEQIREQVRPLSTENVDLSLAVGRRIAAAIVADVDSPPHDKSLMDGYAVMAADWSDEGGTRPTVATWKIVETIPAGTVPKQTVVSGTCARIMTGAPLPPGADAVIMSELAQPDLDRGLVSFAVERLSVGQHVMRRGQSMRVGDPLFLPGHRVRPVDVGVLAEVGAANLAVRPLPSVAVLATGDELVAMHQRPAASQIRNSNGPMVMELAKPFAAHVQDLGIARDEPNDLRQKIERGLQEDVLILTGGVSEGLVDLVPRTLQGLGVQPVFHKVSIKPGKPIWFGIWDGGADRKRRYVFGLPGNPVSSLVCFQIFVQPCLEQLSGGAGGHPPMLLATLTSDHQVRGPRPTYWPAVTIETGTVERCVRALTWHGSSDLRCLAEADTLIYFPPRETPYRQGEQVATLALRNN